MEREELARKIYAASHITGDFVLRSGGTSGEYFDKYMFEANPTLLMAIGNAMSETLLVPCDLLAGLEMGGIPIATVLSQMTGFPVLFVRKKAKEYGTRKLVEGPDVRGKRVLVVEDVVTSGGQVLESTRELRARGAVVQDVLCVIDRECGATGELRGEGLSFHALFTMSDLKRLAEASHRADAGGRSAHA